MAKKIVTIVGARPQFIKAAAVSRILNTNPAFSEIFVHTGQHYDNNMSQIFFDELELPKSNYHLGIGSGSHGKQTAEMLVAVEKLLSEEKPDWVLIYGDTNSTLAGALAAAKLHIPVAHVEAGLRSFNRRMPEEVNRIVADQLSELLLAPTKQAVANLRNEGFLDKRIHLVGDVMYDAALYYGAKAEQHSQILDTLLLSPKQYVLATIHRAENTDNIQRLSAIFQGLHLLAKEIKVVIPLHPRTRKILNEHADLKDIAQNLDIIEPIGFLDITMLEKNAKLIATDSGGIQKEAFFYQIPCVTMRDETEWVELVDLKWNRVVPPVNAESILKACKQAINTQGEKNTRPYGSGNASELITELLM